MLKPAHERFEIFGYEGDLITALLVNVHDLGLT